MKESQPTVTDRVTVFHRDSKKGQELLYACIGLVEWACLVVIEARHNANYSGDYYFVAILVTALALGVASPKVPHLLVGLLIVGPALLLAGWTAPRGDNDGLWTLWFLFLFISAFLVAGCHRIGTWIGRAMPKGH